MKKIVMIAALIMSTALIAPTTAQANSVKSNFFFTGLCEGFAPGGGNQCRVGHKTLYLWSKPITTESLAGIVCSTYASKIRESVGHVDNGSVIRGWKLVMTKRNLSTRLGSCSI